MTRTEERRLIERATAGDKAAAEALVRAHQPSLYAYMLRMSGRPDIAEDITQDAFVRVFMHLDRFEPTYRFSTWLFTIAKRLYVNAMQKHKPVYDSDAVHGWGPTPGSGKSSKSGFDPDDSVYGQPFSPATRAEDRRSRRDALAEALSGLTDEQREILILFHQHDWPISVIAQHMNMPEGTIKSHLHRSRKRMRQALEEHSPKVASEFSGRGRP
ncbi:MAG: RNA polymerase sigma factor [Phycisphaerales bacterium]